MSAIAETILAQLDQVGPGKSIDPMNVAKAVQPEGWQRLLPQVRAEAVMLAREGRIVILRHNKPADPDSFKGVWRVRLPDQNDTP